MLEIDNLVKVYPGPVPALQGIQLSIPKGMFGLLGPNGSGKSTLMNILAGLLAPTSGRVSMNGHDIVEQPEWIWQRLGYLPQAFGFYPHLSGESMLLYMLQLKGIKAKTGLKSLCAELLERVNLSHAAKQKVKTYSGGMKQRLGIAQAIAGSPELLIVDEPTAGLDPEERNRFYRILSELAADRTVLLSTHIVDDVATLCPRFAIIRNGRLLANTTPKDARALLEKKIFQGSVSHDELTVIDNTYQITQALLVEGINQIRVFVPNGSPPTGFSPVEPSLEDAYFVLKNRIDEPNGTDDGLTGGGL